MKMIKHSLNGVLKRGLFFVIIAIIFYSISVLTQPETITVSDVNGIVDLTQVDIESIIAVLPASENRTFYPNHLYTPSDIGKGTPAAFNNDVQYGTYRLLLRLSPYKTYGLSMRSSNFSQRTFINGEEQNGVGVVGASRETTTP